MKNLLYTFFCLFIIGFSINVTAAAIEGTVTDAKTGLPVMGVSITFSTNPESSIPIGYNYYANTDSSGHYYVSDVKPGVYVILAERKNYESFNPEKILIPDSTSALIEYNFQLMPIIIPQYKYGKISGKVTYEIAYPTPVIGAHVTAIPAEKEIFIEPWMAGDMAVTDSIGKYSFSVPEGKYRVLCYEYSQAGFYHEFYFNTSDPKKAIIIEVKADSEVNYVDFGLPKLQDDTVKISISGKVSDNNGNPAPRAYVHVELPDICTFRYDPMVELGSYTDESGNYNITFPLYKAYYAHNSIVYAKKDGYEVEFYKEKKNYYEADRLNFDSTHYFRNIDFTLEQVAPEQRYSISGKVFNDKGIPVQSALVIGMNEISNQYLYALSDSSGFYSIPNVPAGKCYLLFLAKGYVPEFYNNALKWEEAIPIAVDKNIENIDASLNQIVTLPADTSLIIISGIIKSSSNTALPNVLVAVLNSGNKVVAYDITNASGEYYIEGLAKGNYTIQASLVNYSSKNENFSVNTSGMLQVINFNLTPAVPTAINEKKMQVPAKLKLYPNHPNPFNPSTIISFALPSPDYVTLKVYNIIGQEVATLINGTRLNAGTYNINFDAKGLGTGVYLYQLKTSSISVVKKMLLTK